MEKNCFEGQPTLLKFLKTAVRPVGKAMYVWGGGWNEADTGAGEEAVHLGCSPRWEEFADMQDKDYDFHTTKYQIHDGLDCSGYVGWAVYNTLETEHGRVGYVESSGKIARRLAERGFGVYRGVGFVKDFLAGDVMSTSGHVYIVLGACADHSVLLVHASPPGVQICGTSTPQGERGSEALQIAERYMRAFYPTWYDRYHDCARSDRYLKDYDQFRWNEKTLPDPDGLKRMDGGEVMERLYGPVGEGRL